MQHMANLLTVKLAKESFSCRFFWEEKQLLATVDVKYSSAEGFQINTKWSLMYKSGHDQDHRGLVFSDHIIFY